jgi:hypothetical protein
MFESSNLAAGRSLSGRSRVINRIALKFVDVPQNSLARSHNGAIEEQGNRAIAENLKSFATSE